MRELKPLIVVIIVVGIIYWGVEPLAHSIMHPKTPEPQWGYNDKVVTGDAQAGEAQVVANCAACHSIESQGINAPMSPTDSANAYGVVPPDLSNAGKIYNESFLYEFIKDPVKATHLEHKFGPDSGKAYPMPGYEFLGDQVIMDMVAYLKSIAPETVSPKEVTEAACQRCHSIKYGGIEMETPKDIVTNYMGSTPPDLSMMIKSRGHHYLETFINDPQVTLEGTAMPRVGLTKEATAEVVEYLESVGDAKKDERESMGPKFLIYFAILAILAYLWKAKIWRELH